MYIVICNHDYLGKIYEKIGDEETAKQHIYDLDDGGLAQDVKMLDVPISQVSIKIKELECLGYEDVSFK